MITLASKKHIVAIYLLAIICYPGLLFLYLQASKIIVRYEMLEKLEREQLTEITLPKKDVVWFEQDKEIVVDNRMFDVKSSIDKNDSIVFKGLFDEKETLLKKRVSDLVDKKRSSSSLNDVSITTIIFQLGYLSTDFFNLPEPSGNNILYMIRRSKEKLPEGHNSLPYAPPEPIV